jgi:hypothetical protein
VDAWCARTGHPRGYSMSFARMWTLARVWYPGRGDAGWRGRAPEEAQAVLESVELTGDFWRLM